MIGRALILLGLVLLGSGCAAHPGGPGPTAAGAGDLDQREFDQATTASALLFDPPMYMNDLPPELSREGRERAAFVAYEDQSTTFSYIRIDDRQTGDNRERYERRAIMERFGSSTR
ncbi:hypothetical protein BH09PLA1_BH09PLA1_19750 [soil metagenome]